MEFGLPFIMCTGVAYVVLYPIQGLHNHDQICLTHCMETTGWKPFKVANYLQMALPMGFQMVAEVCSCQHLKFDFTSYEFFPCIPSFGISVNISNNI